METDFKETEKNLENLNNQKKQLSLDNGQLQKDFDEVLKYSRYLYYSFYIP